MVNEITKKIMERIEDLKNKNRKSITISLTGEAYDVVKRYLDAHDVTFSAVMDEYVKELAEDIKKEEANRKKKS